jgi:hypothetical protein
LSRSPCIIFDTGMPVARDTTSAISSAPTCVRKSCGFFACSLASVLSAFLSRASSWQLAVLQLRHRLPVALALRLVHLQLDLVDLFLDVRARLDLRLSRLATPRRGRRIPRPRRNDFVVDRGQPLLRRVVAFPSSPPRARS